MFKIIVPSMKLGMLNASRRSKTLIAKRLLNLSLRLQIMDLKISLNVSKRRGFSSYPRC